MFSFFRRSFRHWARSGTPTGTARTSTRKLHCESLEERTVPALTSTSTLVNTVKTGVQNQAVTAVAKDGSSVVVWTEMKSSTDGDIKAQRYDTEGRKTGGEILVASGRNPQHHPSVAMDGYGSFAIVWTHDFAPGDGDIHGQRFKADGARVGDEFVIASAPQNEYDASVGRAANGDLVVSYTHQYNRTDRDVRAVLIRANGTVARKVTVADTSRVEERARVSVAADGRFAISYQASSNIFVSRYSASGSRLGAHTVAATSRVESNASVGISNSGNVVVAWQEQYGRDSSILGRAISSTGQLGRVFTVMAVSGVETLPSVGVDPTSGKSVVAYQTQIGSVSRVQATEFTERQSYVRTSIIGSNLSNASVSVGGPTRRFLLAAQSTARTSYDADAGVFAVFGTL